MKMRILLGITALAILNLCGCAAVRSAVNQANGVINKVIDVAESGATNSTAVVSATVK